MIMIGISVSCTFWHG